MSSRRDFLRFSGLAALGLAAARRRARARPRAAGDDHPVAPTSASDEGVSLFLCGDVMTGRGVDQILARPSVPGLHESWIRSAVDYVKLAERENGPIPRSVAPAYIWGDALDELDRRCPDVRMINLETSVTTSEDWKPKRINYRMHPDNVECITAGAVDCCVLANNHVLDWGNAGLLETLTTLRRAGLATVGAGKISAEAEAPAVLEIAGSRRLLLWAWGTTTSGIPRDWQATESRPGVNLLPDLSTATARRIASDISRKRRPADRVGVSIHWGGNWGYDIPARQRDFAHTLIDEAGVDFIHGHSSHHPKGIEVYRERPILYGCGDFINDYEGIGGYEEYRSELVFGYLIRLEATSGCLLTLELIPFRTRRFRLEAATAEEAAWLRETLDRESSSFGAGVRSDADDRLWLRW
ncbi:MAG: CapA family protein [Thermoanaerobaculia bacterium]